MERIFPYSKREILEEKVLFLLPARHLQTWCLEPGQAFMREDEASMVRTVGRWSLSP